MVITIPETGFNYKIKENFISDSLYKELKNFLYGDKVSWFYREKETDNMNKDFTFGYFTFCWYNNGQPDHPLFFSQILPILDKLNCKAPIQVRANLTFNRNVTCSGSGWHVDNSYKNSFTSIIYFTTSNATTLLKINDKIISVNSLENRLLLFNSCIEHKVVYGDDTNKRIIMNLNYF
jgi:hypothetical protein